MNKDKWVMPKNTTVGGRYITDPRLLLARHISWLRPHSTDTEYSTPEPDNFNYAVLNPGMEECPFIKNHVFIRDVKTKYWWTIYHVPEAQEEDFLNWAEPRNFVSCFTPHRYSKLRRRRPFLWARANNSDSVISENERLYLMGYYDNLQQEFNIDLKANVGEPRPWIIDHQFDINTMLEN
jgi:hypothetical protein